MFIFEKLQFTKDSKSLDISIKIRKISNFLGRKSVSVIFIGKIIFEKLLYCDFSKMPKWWIT